MLVRNLIFSSICVSLLFPIIGRTEPTADRSITDFRLPDHLGKDHALADFADRDLVVVAFLGTECPLAKLYAGRLQTIADEYADRGVAVVAVMSNAQDSLSEIAAFVRQHNVTYPVLKDRRNEVADQFGAERTPQVFLLDREREVRYEGRVDDQYLVGVMRDKPTREDLRAGDRRAADRQAGVGSPDRFTRLHHRPRSRQERRQLGHLRRDIAPILQSRCVECHRAGEIGPFELTSYDDAAGWGEMIAEVVRDRRMPPWHANPKHGSFANDRSMPAAEKELIYKWVKNGCPEGDPHDLPDAAEVYIRLATAARARSRGRHGRAVHVPAKCRPRRRAVPAFPRADELHRRQVDRRRRSAAGQSAGRASHDRVRRAARRQKAGRLDISFCVCSRLAELALPEGSAKRIPAGSTLVFEMHYTPNGSVQQDKTRVGFLFADVEKIDKEVITAKSATTISRFRPAPTTMS